MERLPEVASNKELVQEVKETNNPGEAFLSEFDYNFGWNFVPMAVLYQLYTLWYQGSHAGNNTRLGDRNFGKMIRQIAVTRDDMECKKDRPKNSAYNTSKMTCPTLWKYKCFLEIMPAKACNSLQILQKIQHDLHFISPKTDRVTKRRNGTAFRLFRPVEAVPYGYTLELVERSWTSW